MIKGQIERLKNPSGKPEAHSGSGPEAGETAKASGDERLIHLEQLVQEMNARLKTIEGRLPAASKP
jgi:hypothetical protein